GGGRNLEKSLTAGGNLPPIHEGLRTRRWFNRQRPIEDGQADDFGACDGGAVRLAARSEEEGAGMIGHTGFFAFAGKNIGGFIRQRMDVRRDGYARSELAQDGHAAGGFVFV